MANLLLSIIYLAFISLGLPDSLLGSAWPTIYREFDVPVSFAGIIFIIISAGTVSSSLLSDYLTRRLGTGKVTALSVLITAVALWGFSVSSQYWMLVLWAIPYGLGAGSVDASLNNYVALHYKSRHMSWLHCMWGIGASVGPYIMSYVMLSGGSWNTGYLSISIIQLVLTAVLLISLPLWKRNKFTDEQLKVSKPMSLKEVIKLPGVKQVMLMFFCYCALEQSAGLWASTYLNIQYGVDSGTAASFGSLFFIGITVGRAISGFVTMKLNDHQMISLGQGIILIGVILMCLPLGYMTALIGLIVVGLGCAPIYPCIIHSTPQNFGQDRSQSVIGVQMASAYVGNIAMPPLFGIISNHIGVYLLPFYLLLILAVMFFMHSSLKKTVAKNRLA